MKPVYQTSQVKIYQGNCLEVLDELPAKSVQCCITSPPYFGLRIYAAGDEQIGSEATPEEFVAAMVEVFRKVRRVLRDDGVLWINLGDSYNAGGRKTNGTPDKGRRAKDTGTRSTAPELGPKQLIGIPWRVALALQADGWILRSEIIWYKRNAMPESMKDRCSRNHEHVFMLTKSPQYYFDMEAIREKNGNEAHPEEYQELLGEDWEKGKDRKNTDQVNGRNAPSNKKTATTHPNGRAKRTVWDVVSSGDTEKHFAQFPERLVRPMILASTSQKGCCAECGAPWHRTVARERVATRPGKKTKVDGNSAVVGNRDTKRHITKTKTLDWEPSCDCKCDEIVPCVVLDCFAGTSTTLAAALKKNRRAIGLELSPEYIEISKRKIKRAMLKKGFGL